MNENTLQLKQSLPYLNHEAWSYISSLRKDVRDHQTNLYFAMIYMDCLNKTMPEGSLIVKLRHLGLNEASAKMISNLIEKNPVADHQSVLHWAKNFARSFKGFNTENIGYSDGAKNDAKDFRKIQTTKTSNSADNNTRNELAKIYKEQKENKNLNYNYWFHGTSQNNAEEIVTNGINLKKGQHFGDFSDGHGFYVTEDLEFAENWARMSHGNGAIVVFTVSKGLLKGGLEIADNNIALWRTVVAHFRNGCNNIKLEKLDDFPYISGPISRPNKQLSASLHPTHRHNKQGRHMLQVCLKGKDIVKKFYNEGQNIERIILLDNSNIP